MQDPDLKAILFAILKNKLFADLPLFNVSFIIRIFLHIRTKKKAFICSPYFASQNISACWKLSLFRKKSKKSKNTALLSNMKDRAAETFWVNFKNSMQKEHLSNCYGPHMFIPCWYVSQRYLDGHSKEQDAGPI